REGRPLLVTPGWTRWTFALIVAVVVATAAYFTLGRVHEYVVGVAFVRSEGRSELFAPDDATVATVDVQPGQHVRAGDPLAELTIDDGRTTRLVRAPRAGVVDDVRIRAGEHLDRDDVMLSFVGDEARASVVALLPGSYRSLLRPGMPLRLYVEGYHYAYRDLVVDSVADAVVGAAEARRFLGPDAAAAVRLDGPVVLVRARLPGRTFDFAGRTYDFYDGLRGLAEVRLRSEPILFTLVPQLRLLGS
ncbi:MAG TPA: HlyD family secretion protein, partial [Polyangia bacterium]